MSGDKGNSLLVHAIVVICVGVGMCLIGGVDAFKTVVGKAGKGGKGGGVLAQARQAEMMANQGSKLATGGLPTLPTKLSIGAISGMAGKAQSTMAMVKKFLALGWVLLCGIGMIVTGVFLLKEKNWARYVAFGGLSFCLCYFTGMMGVAMAKPNGKFMLPAILIAIVTVLVGKFLWDVLLDQFDEPAPAAK